MAIDWAVWGPPALVLGVGVAFGFLTVSRLRGPADGAIGDEGRRRDLESTRDEVLEQLRALELEKDKMPPANYERERHALLARGSRALEALDTGAFDKGPVPPAATALPIPGAGAPGAAGAGAPPAGLAPEWKGALYALAAVGLVVGLWQFAQSESVTRKEGASMTGNQSLGVESDPAEALRADAGFQKQLADLEAKVAANPEDYAAHNELTHLYLVSNDPGKAIQHNDLVLKADPKNLDARTYRGLLAVMMGMPDKGLEQLDAVLAENPDHARAIVYRAMVLFQQGKMQEAVDALTAAAAAHPDDMELHSLLAQAKQAMSAPPQAPPMGGPSGGGGEVIVAGTAELDPSLAAALTGSETLFVSVSDPARPKPPVAADRVNGPLKFPLAFEITTDEIRAMPGAGGVPELLDVKVRIDTDGNAMTQEAAPLAVVTGVHKGTGGLVVKLTLDGAPVAAPAGGGSSLVAPLAPAPGGATLSGGGELLASGVANLRSGSVTGAEVVFVSVRDPAGGPPYASKKVPAAFPLTFTLTTADVIQMGGARPIPDTFNVVVRVDRDGNAMTKDGEPEATATGVKKGASKLELWLE